MDRAGSVRGGIIGDDSRGAGLGEQHVLMTGALSFQGAGLPDVRWEEMEMEMEACSSIAQRSVHSAPELLLQLLAALHAAQQAKHDALRVARSAAAQPQLLLAGWRALQVAGPQHGRERDLSGRRGGQAAVVSESAALDLVVQKHVQGSDGEVDSGSLHTATPRREVLLGVSRRETRALRQAAASWPASSAAGAGIHMRVGQELRRRSWHDSIHTPPQIHPHSIPQPPVCVAAAHGL